MQQKEIKQLLKQIQNGNDALVKQVLENHQIHWSDIPCGQTCDSLLHFVAKLNQSQFVDYLLSNFNPKCVDFRNKDDKTALHEAAQCGHYDVCCKLLEHGADVNALKRADWTPIMLACTKLQHERSQSKLNIVKLFLKAGALIDFVNKDGWTCLHLTAREGHVGIMQLLIEHGIDVKLQTNNGRTALHIAALHGKTQIVELLLSLGGLCLEVKDKCGNTALHEAVLGGNVDICKILIKNGADVHAKNNSSYNLLHLAASEGHMNMLEYLIFEVKQLDVNESNENGITPLHCAARKNKRDAFDFLVKNGSNERAVDCFQRTPVDYFS